MAQTEHAEPAGSSPWADPDRARAGIERLTRTSAASRPTADEIHDELRRTRLELAVYKTASQEGADAARLLRTRAFVLAVRDLDPEAEHFARTLARAVRSALDDDPRLAAS